MARRRSVESDDGDHPEPVDELRDLCRREGLPWDDASLLRMANGLFGTRFARLEDHSPFYIREAVARIKATRSLYGPLENRKGQEWFLKRKGQEVEDERTD